MKVLGATHINLAVTEDTLCCSALGLTLSSNEAAWNAVLAGASHRLSAFIASVLCGSLKGRLLLSARLCRLTSISLELIY